MGSRSGTTAFNIIKSGDDEAVMSSVLTPAYDAQVESVTVPIHRLDDVLPGILPIANARIFLKMDTQGYDLEVFDGAGDREDIVLLQSEIDVQHAYEGMPHYTESLMRYQQAGFGLVNLFVVARAPDGTIGELDSLLSRVERS